MGRNFYHTTHISAQRRSTGLSDIYTWPHNGRDVTRKTPSKQKNVRPTNSRVQQLSRHPCVGVYYIIFSLCLPTLYVSTVNVCYKIVGLSWCFPKLQLNVSRETYRVRIKNPRILDAIGTFLDHLAIRTLSAYSMETHILGAAKHYSVFRQAKIRFRHGQNFFENQFISSVIFQKKKISHRLLRIPIKYIINRSTRIALKINFINEVLRIQKKCCTYNSVVSLKRSCTGASKL